MNRESLVRAGLIIGILTTAGCAAKTEPAPSPVSTGNTITPSVTGNELQNPKATMVLPSEKIPVPTPTIVLETPIPSPAEISLNPLTLKKGEFDEIPMAYPNNETGVYLTSQYPTIIAYEANPSKNGFIVTVKFEGDKLTRTRLGNNNYIIYGKTENPYKDTGLTIRYLIDESTSIRKNNPKAQGGSDFLGDGLISLLPYDKNIKIGGIFTAIGSSFAASSSNLQNIRMNQKGYQELKNGQSEISLYAQVVVIP
jgi:hypothetical protein